MYLKWRISALRELIYVYVWLSTVKTKRGRRGRGICWDVLNFNKNCNEEYEARAIFQSLIALSWISRGTLHFHHAQLIRSSSVPWVFPHLVRPMSHVPIKMLINVCLFLRLPSSFFPTISLNCAIKKVIGAELPRYIEYDLRGENTGKSSRGGLSNRETLGRLSVDQILTLVCVEPFKKSIR